MSTPQRVVASSATSAAAGGNPNPSPEQISSVPEIPTTPAILAKDISEFYDIHDSDEIGKGAFSRVVTATQRGGKKEKRAIKIMQMSAMNDRKVLSMMAHEKEILRRTKHPNILNLYETVTTPDRVYMAMELLKGDLFEFTVGRRRKLNEIQCAQVMKQLFASVAYLHSINVVHRDIKLENILVNDWNDIRLADFGLAKVIRDPSPGAQIKNTPCGTGFYIAPEVITAIDSGYSGITALVTTSDKLKLLDLWSCGVVMYVLLSGRPPFSGQVKTAQERKELMGKISTGVLFPDQHWAHISKEAKDLIAKLLERDSNARVTADFAGSHPWFGIQEQKLIEYYAHKKKLKEEQEQQEAAAAAKQKAGQEQQEAQQEAPATAPVEPETPATAQQHQQEAADVRNAMNQLQEQLQDDAEENAGTKNEQRADVSSVTAAVPNAPKMSTGPPKRKPK